jgi:hypothetical protein
MVEAKRNQLAPELISRVANDLGFLAGGGPRLGARPS